MHPSLQQYTMSPRTSLDFSRPSCRWCSEARRQRKVGCNNCLNEVRLKNSFPKVDTVSSKSPAGHIEATVLFAILKRHAKNPHARFTALEAVKRPVSNIKSSTRSKNTAVRLVKRNPDKDTPAIWLHPAEGTAPTMHYHSWCALGRPTPRENKIYIGMNNIRRPHHIRGEHCEQCVADAWMNASLRLTVQGFSELEIAGKEKEIEMTKKTREQKRVIVKKAFGNLRESFRSQSPKKQEEVAKHPSKPAKRQEATVKRI